MALTESYMLPLKTPAPNFSLPNVISGKTESLLAHRGKSGTLIIFMCNHCPYVVHLRAALIQTAESFLAKGVTTLAISSNSIISHPQDGPEAMKKLAAEEHFNFPYFFDESQEVAHAYQAACTPDFYLFDADLTLYYRGRFDNSRPGNENPITGQDLHNACDTMLQGVPFDGVQYPSMGCNIKWKEGNNPQDRL